VRVAVIGLAALVTTWTSAGAAAGSSVSGLRGVVMKESGRPVCVDDPCEVPAGGVVLDFRRDGNVVAEVKTSSSGTYWVKLRAGSYAVSARRRVGTGLSPRIVRVPPGRVARVDFHLDTGRQ
jgi:hypothetical protein